MEPRPGVCTKWARTVGAMTANRRQGGAGLQLGFDPGGPYKARCEGFRAATR